jgi:peptidoglycan/xylan/chitin deacetylase (PgdA/CDA1 family)
MARPASPFATRSFTRDKMSWLVVLLLLMVAGSYGYYWQLHPETRQPQPIDATTDNPHIVVLAYDHIVEKPNGLYITQDQLRSQLTALSADGFQPISVQALHDFFYRNGKLPAKPVLLTFDHGYLETYQVAHPVLVGSGWRAAISLTSNKQEQRDTHYLYWDRLERMLNGGFWEILSHGHRAYEPVQVSEDGVTAPFATNAMWYADTRRLETAGEFAARIAQDIAEGNALIHDKLQVQVLGYVFPYGTPERIFHDAELLIAEQQIRSTVSPLAFSDDDFGVNDRRSDPHNLRRLHVSPSWSAHDLTQRLQAALEFPGISAAPLHLDDHWIPAIGNVRVEPAELRLNGAPRAQAWLGGSQWMDNWTLTSRVQVSQGDFWLLQSDTQRGTEWRLGGDTHGLFLKQLKHGTTVATHWADSAPIENGWHELKIIKRGTGVWAVWDGVPLWERPVFLVEPVIGPLGWLAWSEDGNSKLSIADTTLVPIPYNTRALGSHPAAPDVQRLADHPELTAALSPALFTLRARILEEHSMDEDLFKLLSHRYAWQLAPTITFTPDVDTETEPLAPLDTLLARAAQENWGGLHLDLSALPATAQVKLAPALAQLEQRLQREHQHLLITHFNGQLPQVWQADSALHTAAQP